MAFRKPFLTVIAFALVAALAACNLPSQAVTPEGVLGATPSQPAPQTLGQCKNPLHPVIKGAAWTYSLSGITSGSFTRTITAVREDGFTDQDVYDAGVTRTGEWKCEDGTLTALAPAEGLSSMIQSGGVTAQFETTESEGITLPAIVTPGAAWTQSFTLEGTQTIAGNSAKSTGEMSYSCKAADIETVSVPAGVFDAVRVGCQINATISVSTAGLEVPTEWASATTIWYARDIGMVKTENELSGVGHSSIELTSYTIP
jgi:hypothetical protein